MSGASAALDQGRSVREGEELPIDRVDAWLKRVDPSISGIPTVTQFSGGASNWTYRLDYGSRDLVLRRPPAGTKAKSAHDMSREYAVQRALQPSFPQVPAMVGLCEDEAVIGAPFYVMERIAGVIPRKDMPRGVSLDAEAARRLCARVVDLLVELHRVDWRAAGLASISKGPGYARRQIEGWSDRYERARTWNVPGMKRVRAWLAERTPEDIGACVVHGDWRLDNCVLDAQDPTRVIGVLDWEMATIGDPLMDLGNSLAYWVHEDDPWLMRATRRQPSHLPGMLRREEIVARYLEKTGLKPALWEFYEVYGLFRLAAIAQQIYYRYHHGQTTNPAFRWFWVIVSYLGWRCRAVMRRA